ncbi:MAG: hypothetical protein KAQ83_00365 [Nanoarchaeota archaeon]|nr:hypothetical protein [Nanoarchaeota archaeon]
MAGFESFRQGRGSSSRGGSSRGGRSRDSGRSFDRKPRFGGRGDSKPFEMTRVTCSACGKSCEVPFKPTTSKPVYCNDCFSKTNQDSRPSRGPAPKGISEADLDIINGKLNKIMKALKIE